jgi:hypothetical protein
MHLALLTIYGRYVFGPVVWLALCSWGVCPVLNASSVRCPLRDAVTEYGSTRRRDCDNGTRVRTVLNWSPTLSDSTTTYQECLDLMKMLRSCPSLLLRPSPPRRPKPQGPVTSQARGAPDFLRSFQFQISTTSMSLRHERFPHKTNLTPTSSSGPHRHDQSHGGCRASSRKVARLENTLVAQVYQLA